MEYRWAVVEGQRGILSRGMGLGCIDKPPAEAWGSTGISDLGGLGGDETPVEV